jgi:hypothetical protein
MCAAFLNYLCKGEDTMKQEERDRLLDNASMVFLAAANVLDDAKTSLEGDDELEALGGVLLRVHFYMQERIRSWTEPLSSLTIEQAEKLAAQRERLAEKLGAIGDLFALNAKEKFAVTVEHITTEQRTASAPFEQVQLLTAAT